MVLYNSQEFIAWMQAAGIPANARRIVVDAEVGQVTRIYVECYGSPDMLKVSVPPEFRTGIQIIVGQSQSKEVSEGPVIDGS